jgi:3-dehydroquinate synthase
MSVDKKAQGGATRFVVLEAPGRAALHAVPDALVRDVIDARQRAR